MYSNMPIREKCIGTMLGSAIGDALGWPHENRSYNISKDFNKSNSFIEWTRKTGGRYWNHYEKILPGEYSDDTQLILCVTRSLISGNWENFFTKNELPFWLNYERGGGTAIKRAAKNLKAGKLPWESEYYKQYYDAGGNGAVMRILPHVIIDLKKPDTTDLLKNVIHDSIFTHGHPRAILGATCYAYILEQLFFIEDTLTYGDLINCALDGFEIWSRFNNEFFPLSWTNCLKKLDFNYIDVWNNVALQMKKKLIYIQNVLKKGILVNDREVLKNLDCFEKSNGAGDVAILTALYLSSKYANNPTLAIQTAAYCEGIDTDTIASITGGIVGCLFGNEWIPLEWHQVQDYSYLCDITDILLSDNMTEMSREKKKNIVNNNNLWKSSPIGKICEISKHELKSNDNTNITSTKCITSLGQTIYLKDYKRINRDYQTKTKETNDNAFVIDNKQIDQIRSNKLFDKLTVKKMISVVDMILKGGYPDEYIASKNKVSEEIVKYFRDNIFTS